MQSPKVYVSDTISYCFDPKKVVVQAMGLVLSGMVLTFFSTIASNISCINFLISIVGVFLALIPVLFSMTASSLMFLSEIKYDKEISIKKAYIMSSKRLYSMFSVTIQGLSFAVLATILFFLISLIVKIPYIGEMIISILYLPSFAIACFIVTAPFFLIILLHTIPYTLIKFPDKQNILKKISIILRHDISNWISVFSLSTLTGIGFLLFHYIAMMVNNTLLIMTLGEKFYKLLTAIPSYPGYLLSPWIKRYIPCDFVLDCGFSYTIGSFFWGLIMHLIICLFISFVLNLWNFIGVYYLTDNNSSKD